MSARSSSIVLSVLDGIASSALSTSASCFASGAVGDDAGPPHERHSTPFSISAAR
jgi:hypothetical protein